MKLRQWERVLEYLNDFGSITPLQALAETEKSQNRYGQPVRYARYRLAA